MRASWAMPLVALAASSLLLGCASFGSKSIEELHANADEAFVREEYKRSIAFDSEILRRSPSDFKSTLQRGVSEDRLGAPDDAMVDYTRAAELDASAGLPHLYRANLALHRGQIEVAGSDVQALQGMELPKDQKIAAAVIEGTFWQRKGDLPSALRAYKPAIDAGRSDPDQVVAKHYRDALNNASECYFRLGVFDRAADLYAELLAAKSHGGDTIEEDDHYMMGVLAYLRGDFARAHAELGAVSGEKRDRAAKLLNDESFLAAR